MLYIGFSPVNSIEKTQLSCVFLIVCIEKGLSMTQLEISYRYTTPPGESEMRALDAMREVYGIRRITFNEKDHVVKIEYDASRLKEPVIAGLLRKAGMDLAEKLVLA
jgi:hypothetical protein